MAIVEIWTGVEASALRQALRLSVRDFAQRELGVSVRTVSNWESRGSSITAVTEMQRALDTALARADDDVRARFRRMLQRDEAEPRKAIGLPDVALRALASGRNRAPSPFTLIPPASSWASPVYDAVLYPTEAVRRVRSDVDTEAQPDDFAVLRRLAGDVLIAHLSSDFARLSSALPQLIGCVEAVMLGEDDLATAVRPLLSDVYAVAAWTLIKADNSVAAWIAAQRAIQVAEQADDVLRVAAATRCLSEVHMRAKNFEEATRTAFLATVQLDTAPSADRKTALCLRGAALLSGAAAAARRGDRREAYAALRAAAVCADELGEDRSDLGTVFGPTNVAIHEVAVAVELGDTNAARQYALAVNLDRMPSMLTERRARFLIDVARSHAGQQDAGAAIDALLQAERIAPLELREHRLTHELLRDLLTRERRSSGLRQLAARCNLAE